MSSGRRLAFPRRRTSPAARSSGFWRTSTAYGRPQRQVKPSSAKPAPKDDGKREKRTITEIRDSKTSGEKMVYMSVPDYTSAQWAEMAGVDVAVRATRDRGLEDLLAQRAVLPVGDGDALERDDRIALSHSV